MARVKKSEQTKTPNSQKEFVFAIGRRREAVARVRLYSTVPTNLWGTLEIKKGDFFVNSKPYDQYFQGEVAKTCLLEPLTMTNSLNRFVISAKVEGGGRNGQLEAVIHGLSRALAEFDKENLRPILKKKGFLTRDARIRERRKVGTGGKARRKKQSPKR